MVAGADADDLATLAYEEGDLLAAEERGDYALALDRYKESQRLAEAVGRRTGAGHLNIGELLLDLGAYAEAEAELQVALSINREQGALKGEALALRALSRLYHLLGRHDAAVAQAAAALDIVRRINDPSAEAHVSLCLGRALTGQGALAEAAAAYARALALQRELGQQNRAPAALAGLALVRLAQGDLAVARELVAEVLGYLDQAPLNGVPGRADVAWACFEVLGAAGDERAATVLAAAHEDLEARAARISDAALRRAFLENVTVHRAITAEWRAQAGE